jgi:fructose-1,6-bisphosphatase/inositol monophosphatase family enzyme
MKINVDRKEAYELFRNFISTISEEIAKFTRENKIGITEKDDRTLVTECDKYIDKITGSIAQEKGFSVISEERENDLDTLRSGNYVIIDAIDGTLGYIKHTQSSADKTNPHINSQLGYNNDYSFLSAIIINGKPRFGLCYNYVTSETILLDSEDSKHTIWENKNPIFNSKNAHYIDLRCEDFPNKRLSCHKDTITYQYTSPGMAFIYAQLNNHDSAAIYHFPQQNGLWDIAPACVAAGFSNTHILDGNGEPIKFKDYLDIPKKGLVLIKGNKFNWLRNYLN